MHIHKKTWDVKKWIPSCAVWGLMWYGKPSASMSFNRYVGELKRHSSTLLWCYEPELTGCFCRTGTEFPTETSGFFGVDSKTRKRWKRPSQKCVSPSQVPRKSRLQVDVLRWKVEYSALWSLGNFLKLCPTLGSLIYSKMVISLTYTQVIPWILHLTYRSSIALSRSTSTGIYREKSWPSRDSNPKPSDQPCQILTGAYQQDWPE